MLLHNIAREITASPIPLYVFGVNRDGTGWCYSCQTLGHEYDSISHEVPCAADKLQTDMDQIFYCECGECRGFAAYHLAEIRYDDDGNIRTWRCIPCENGEHVTI